MTNTPSTHFHSGELALQESVGAREKMDRVGQMMMRDHMINQHRTFFAGLEYVFLAVIDAKGRPQPLILTGPAGFVCASDPHILRIDLSGPQDIASLGPLKIGGMIAVLGLNLSNRRRNRMHGRIVAANASFLEIRVVQSYGNCPKYINRREIVSREETTDPAQLRTSKTLSQADRALISQADTFFIASLHDSGSNAKFDGADISHRGGEAGFVQLGADDNLTVPDYRGNNMFNTLGNVSLYPQVGLLFIDFTTGGLLYLSGKAEIVTEPSSVTRFPAAQRMLKIAVFRSKFQANGVALRWETGTPPPSKIKWPPC
ncbi:MAG: pyridoxamine 5'-phosphate oxidase family protein [Erythrobacter sp.]